MIFFMVSESKLQELFSRCSCFVRRTVNAVFYGGLASGMQAEKQEFWRNDDIPEKERERATDWSTALGHAPKL